VRSYFRQQYRAALRRPREARLASADFQPTPITIPAGEKSKTLQQAAAICDQMIAAGLIDNLLSLDSGAA